MPIVPFTIKENADKLISTSYSSNTLQGKNILPLQYHILPYAGQISSVTVASATAGDNSFTVSSTSYLYVGQGIYNSTYITGVSATITSIVGSVVTIDSTISTTFATTQTFYICPAGWVFCDGTNGTPDLRGFYIAGGTGLGTIGTTIGAANHSHTFSWTLAQTSGSMSHSHTFTNNFNAFDSHNAAHNWGGSRNGGIGNDVIANYVSGNQANICDDNHTHSNNSIPVAGATVTANHSHTHTGQATSGNADGGTHAHTYVTGPTSGTTDSGINSTYVSTYYVNFIMRV